MIIKMYKKTIFTLLLFIDPIAVIEQLKKINLSQIVSSKYDIIEKNNLHLTDNLCKDNENRIETKKFWEEEDLLSHQRYSSSKKIFFMIFKKWI